jgi:hypothetical protein
LAPLNGSFVCGRALVFDRLRQANEAHSSGLVAPNALDSMKSWINGLYFIGA